ncbi:hypothetical protein [Flaviaesturariibacter amylovorans]|uniref:RNA ligase domain-containing protein n=1 Tax=Flaviaesturariibacter amylovorans TaxID=1084520 RepID=A0ABP8HPJ3_9BACT
MKKISTLFKKNPEQLGRIIHEPAPENEWVFRGEGIATRKFDGTAAAIIGGALYKRYDVKKGRPVPPGALPCQEPDAISGHHPHWVECVRGTPEDRYFYEAFDALADPADGTYELCGKKVQGNPEGIEGHRPIPHGSEVLSLPDLSYEGLRQYLEQHDIEGIVFHHVSDGRMCKIRKSDFGIRR